jgi:hypothetical protein
LFWGGGKVKELVRKKLLVLCQFFHGNCQIPKVFEIIERNNSLMMNFLQRTGTKIDGSLKIQRTARHGFGPVLAVWVGINVYEHIS